MKEAKGEKNKTILPEYKKGSIVNLISSIAKSFGKKPLYPVLDSLMPLELQNKKNVILIVLDGLGYDYMCQYAGKGFLKDHLLAKLTSVFPSTTASAITTFFTGVAPQQHGITGWFMHLKELGSACAILPFVPRHGGDHYPSKNIRTDLIFKYEPLFNSLNVPVHTVMPEKIINSEFSRRYIGNTKRHSYTTENGFFRQIKKASSMRGKRKLIYGYWSYFDHLCHKHGFESAKVAKHYRSLDKQFEAMNRNLQGTGTTVIITADHGHLNVDKNHVLYLDDHPVLKNCLTLPLCGEPRTIYCYVRPAKTAEFEKYVRSKLSRYCTLYKSRELVTKNYFGEFKAAPELMDRIGDYVLIMKDNYILKDIVLGETEKKFIGNHGGLSSKEFYVPLVVLDC